MLKMRMHVSRFICSNLRISFKVFEIVKRGVLPSFREKDMWMASGDVIAICPYVYSFVAKN